MTPVFFVDDGSIDTTGEPSRARAVRELPVVK
jgi:hypothetical protein